MAFTRKDLDAPGEIESLERQARHWRITCAALFILATAPWWVNWSITSRAQIQPYAIVIDPGHMVLYHGPPGSYDREELWTMTAVQHWLELVRERRGDPVHMAERRHRAKLMVDGHAVTQLEGYLQQLALDPQQASNPMRVQIGQFKWQPPAGHDYAVEWQERWTPTFGHQSLILRVSARLSVERRQSMGPFGHAEIKAGDMNRNPLGAYITAISWMETWEDPPDANRVAAGAR